MSEIFPNKPLNALLLFLLGTNLASPPGEAQQNAPGGSPPTHHVASSHLEGNIKQVVNPANSSKVRLVPLVPQLDKGNKESPKPALQGEASQNLILPPNVQLQPATPLSGNATSPRPPIPLSTNTFNLNLQNQNLRPSMIPGGASIQRRQGANLEQCWSGIVRLQRQGATIARSVPVRLTLRLLVNSEKKASFARISLRPAPTIMPNVDPETLGDRALEDSIIAGEIIPNGGVNTSAYRLSQLFGALPATELNEKQLRLAAQNSSISRDCFNFADGWSASEQNDFPIFTQKHYDQTLANTYQYAPLYTPSAMVGAMDRAISRQYNVSPLAKPTLSSGNPYLQDQRELIRYTALSLDRIMVQGTFTSKSKVGGTARFTMAGYIDRQAEPFYL